MNSTVVCGPEHADGRRRKMEVFIGTLMLLEPPDDPNVADAPSMISMMAKSPTMR